MKKTQGPLLIKGTTMQVTTVIKLLPFKVPNFVLTEAQPKPRPEGFQKAPKYALCELDAETLEQMCEEFTRSVFEKAGKTRPPMVSAG